LWFAAGSGAAGRRILGTVVITGMLAATTIAIFIIPMLFVLVEKIAARLSRKLHPHDAALPSPSGADD
jgi:HAE1 family hydrophobic/amphiphilic exporter-1